MRYWNLSLLSLTLCKTASAATFFVPVSFCAQDTTSFEAGVGYAPSDRDGLSLDLGSKELLVNISKRECLPRISTEPSDVRGDVWQR